MSSTSALSLYDSELPGLRIGCDIIDNVLGEIPRRGITEISGEAGSGKTQFCLTYSLRCQLDMSMGGLSTGQEKSSTAYLCCGEGDFPIRRLNQIAQSIQAKTGISETELLSRVHCQKCHNSEDAMSTLKKIPSMCQTLNVRLLVVDSIAGIMRTEYDLKNAKERGEKNSVLFRIASELKRLADTFKICIIVVNQVSAEFGNSEGVGRPDFDGIVGIPSDVVPALGLSWSHCVNTRIFLHRDVSAILSSSSSYIYDNHRDVDSRGNMHQIDQHNHSHSNSVQQQQQQQQHVYQRQSESSTSGKSKRFLRLELSPSRPMSICQYEITKDGVRGVRE